jgi:hypothetical protein
MREAPPEQRNLPGGKSSVLAIVLGALLLGGGIGAALFPEVQVQRVEVPVEVIKYVDRVVPVDKVVEKVVEKIVEKRVEVPVEVIKYVERPAPVPAATNNRVDAPAASFSKPAAASPADRLDAGHQLLRVGMDKAGVVALIGQPYFDDGDGGWFYYSVDSRMNVNLKFVAGQLIQINRPK